MSYQGKEMEFVRDVSKAAIMAPFVLYAEAWGLDDKNNKGDTSSSSNPFLAPLTKPLGVLFKDMQKDLNDALKIDIYRL